jgi:hypothetical protein
VRSVSDFSSSSFYLLNILNILNAITPGWITANLYLVSISTDYHNHDSTSCYTDYSILPLRATLSRLLITYIGVFWCAYHLHHSVGPEATFMYHNVVRHTEPRHTYDRSARLSNYYSVFVLAIASKLRMWRLLASFSFSVSLSPFGHLRHTCFWCLIMAPAVLKLVLPCLCSHLALPTCSCTYNTQGSLSEFAFVSQI